MAKTNSAHPELAEKAALSDGAIPVVRTTVNLTPDAIEAVREMARERSTTVADVIRRAIWIEKYLHEALKNGGKVLLEDAEHGRRELIIR
jgi:hypothetical protein